MEQKRINLIFVVLVFIFLSSFASAITASIGNSRMILNLDPSESIERYVLVKNVNDVPVIIEVSMAGDLTDNIKIKGETNFSLEANQEKKVYFTVTAPKSGSEQARINFKFIPDEGAAVGLSSTVIVVVGDSPIPDSIDNTNDNVDNTNTDNPDNTNSNINSNNQSNSSGFTFRPKPTQTNPTSNFNISAPVLLSISTGILIIILIILFIFLYRKKSGQKIKHKKRASMNE